MPLPTIFDHPESVLAVIEAAHGGFYQLCNAQTIPEQAAAYQRLADAMSDLATWHPRFDVDTGGITPEEEMDRCGAQEWWRDDDGSVVIGATCQRYVGHPGRHLEERDGRVWADWSGLVEFAPS